MFHFTLNRNPNCNDVSGGYDFQFNATLSPAKSAFQIGDTISITTLFSDTILDRNSGREFVLEDWGFYNVIAVYKIDTLPALHKVGEQFDLLADFEKHNIVLNVDQNGDQHYFVDWHYEDNTYSLNYKLVCKTPGLFMVEYGGEPYGNQEFEGICNSYKRSFKGFLTINEGSDNQIDFLNESPDEHYNTWILEKPEQRFHRFGGYAFRVE